MMCHTMHGTASSLYGHRLVLMDLGVLPNPAKNAVHFTVQGMTDRSGELIVLDALGRVMLRQKVAAGQEYGTFDVVDWANGVHRLRPDETDHTGTSVTNIF